MTAGGPGTAVLRRRPPAAALAWAAGQVTPRGLVVAVRALTGGMSHANHAVLVAGGDTVDEVVLRRWARPDWRRTDPDFDAHREIAALGLVAGATLPTPRLIAADPAAACCDVPAVLLSRLPGQRFDGPTLPGSAVRALADAVARLHELPVPAGGLPPYQPYVDLADAVPPRRSGWPALWERAVELAETPPAGEPTLVHRDYHPGNTLWQDGRLSGVVDWTAASIGNVGVDIGHMRWNLATLRDADPDAFLRAYADRRPGYEHHPYWDLRPVLDLLLPAGRSPLDRLDLDRLERHMARAVAALTRVPARAGAVRMAP